jgi:hypothetical protein
MIVKSNHSFFISSYLPVSLFFCLLNLGSIDLILAFTYDSLAKLDIGSKIKIG